MGQGNSRELEEDEQVEDYFGVRITHQLLDSLDGTRNVVSAQAEAEAGGDEERGDAAEEVDIPPPPKFQSLYNAPFLQKPSLPDPEPEPEIDHFAHLRTYLNNSEEVGGLLLKVEDEELPKVADRVKELSTNEYLAPVRPPVCQDAKDACLQCYQQHPAEPLACAGAVAAYSACTKESFQSFVNAA